MRAMHTRLPWRAPINEFWHACGWIQLYELPVTSGGITICIKSSVLHMTSILYHLRRTFHKVGEIVQHGARRQQEAISKPS